MSYFHGKSGGVDPYEDIVLRYQRPLISEEINRLTGYSNHQLLRQPSTASSSSSPSWYPLERNPICEEESLVMTNEINYDYPHDSVGRHAVTSVRNINSKNNNNNDNNGNKENESGEMVCQVGTVCFFF